jgi:metallo-beta-lactamase family protein
MQIQFFGATETVTGSKYILTTTKGVQVLLDCGLYQGLGKETGDLNTHFGFDPEKIDVVVLSHAHIDHSGNLPLLVKQGFAGSIYCTPATLEICEVLLLDSAHIQENDIMYVNKRRAKEGLAPLKPNYTVKDVEKCLRHFKTIPYNAEFHLNDEVSLKYTDAGHILGSAVVNLKLTDGTKTMSLTFSGDVGRYNDLLMGDPQPFPQADYILCESTYGSKLHDRVEDAQLKLLNCVKHTCIEKKGKLIIPAFSLGRTQEIVYALDKMKNAGLLPPVKVFVDSPLSKSATDIMRKYSGSLNKQVLEHLKSDSDPFGFDGLTYVTDKEESKRLNESKEPCIIISASGMMDAGRVKHHLKHTLPYQKNTLLIVGYCPPNSLGGRLLNGSKMVKIFGNDIPVNAEMEVISSYSAHADYEELLKFLSCQNKEKVKTIFLVHGEDDSKTGFKKTLMANGFPQVIIPRKAESFNLI